MLPKGNRKAKWGEGLKFIEVALKFKGDDCLFWPFSLANGYGQVHNKNGGSILAHHIICERINGPCQHIHVANLLV